jgi:hypothetical protein
MSHIGIPASARASVATLMQADLVPVVHMVMVKMTIIFEAKTMVKLFPRNKRIICHSMSNILICYSILGNVTKGRHTS